MTQNTLVTNSKDLFENLLSNSKIGLVTIYTLEKSNHFHIEHLNAGFTKMTGYSWEDLEVLYNGQLLNMIYDEDRDFVRQKYENAEGEFTSYELQYRLICKDGSIIWVLNSGCITIDYECENRKYNQGVFIDITERKQQEEELRAAEERYRIAIESSNVCIFEVDLLHQRYTHFLNAERIFGISDQVILNDVQYFSTLSSEEYMIAASNYFCHPEDQGVVAEAFSKINNGISTSYEARMRAGNSHYVWCRIDVTPIKDKTGKPVRMIGKITDIDDLKKQANRFKSQMKIEPFTGLYNKYYTEHIISEIMDDKQTIKSALIIIDIDNFKYVNDTFGHAYGDTVLKSVSNKLTSLFRKEDIIGRIGGDEFLVLMRNIPNTDYVPHKMEQLLNAIRKIPLEHDYHYSLGASIGIFIISNHEESFESAYIKADKALYRTKRKGKNGYTIY